MNPNSQFLKQRGALRRLEEPASARPGEPGLTRRPFTRSARFQGPLSSSPKGQMYRREVPEEEFRPEPFPGSDGAFEGGFWVSGRGAASLAPAHSQGSASHLGA